jgi:hypothetical protein
MQGRRTQKTLWQPSELYFLASQYRQGTQTSDTAKTYFPHRTPCAVASALTRAKTLFPPNSEPPPGYIPPHSQAIPQQSQGGMISLPAPVTGPTDRCMY